MIVHYEIINHSYVHYYNHEEKFGCAHERRLSRSSSLSHARAHRRTRALRGNVALQTRLT